jgi:hypothetical protein
MDLFGLAVPQIAALERACTVLGAAKKLNAIFCARENPQLVETMLVRMSRRYGQALHLSDQ